MADHRVTLAQHSLGTHAAATQRIRAQKRAAGTLPRMLTLLLPDFALILLGWLVCRYTALNRPLWDGVERLVYYLLFPALLFAAIVRQPIEIGAVARLGGIGLAVSLVGIALAFSLRGWSKADPMLHASGAQTAYRFNTYVAFALAERLAGQEGLAWVALLVALCVPVVNVAAVWPMAAHGGRGVWRELLRNPLVLSTVAGLVANLAGLQLPEFAATTLQRVGSAALPLALMAVGAGLKLGDLRQAPGLAAGLMFIRHAVLPAVAIALVLALKLPPPQQLVLVAFAAVPTASSAYVLAVRMGGHGGYVAGLVTMSTLLGLVSVPAALLVLGWLRSA